METELNLGRRNIINGAWIASFFIAPAIEAGEVSFLRITRLMQSERERLGSIIETLMSPENVLKLLTGRLKKNGSIYFQLPQQTSDELLYLHVDIDFERQKESITTSVRLSLLHKVIYTGRPGSIKTKILSTKIEGEGDWAIKKEYSIEKDDEEGVIVTEEENIPIMKMEMKFEDEEEFLTRIFDRISASPKIRTEGGLKREIVSLYRKLKKEGGDSDKDGISDSKELAIAFKELSVDRLVITEILEYFRDIVLLLIEEGKIQIGDYFVPIPYVEGKKDVSTKMGLQLRCDMMTEPCDIEKSPPLTDIMDLTAKQNFVRIHLSPLLLGLDTPVILESKGGKERGS